MTPYYDRDGITIYHGDCLDVMRELPADSVDSIVTDPPYGLSFMGRDWDHGLPGVPFWDAALRVAKPGAHLLAFGGTRTYHRLTCAIEDAGWEIRDCISWVYGSGFPKSLDVGKAIDRRRDEDKEPVRVVCRAIRAAMEKTSKKSRHLVEHFGNCHPRLIDHWAARDTDSQPSCPTWEQWRRLRSVLGMTSELDEEVWRLNGRKGTPGDAWDKREKVGEADGLDYTKTRAGFAGERFSDEPNVSKRYDITAPATAAAKQWDGWGTALKPSFEPIVVARKPLIGTVAQNVLEHGTGAINVDGCRIGTEGGTTRSHQAPYAESGWRTGHEIEDIGKGRFPANLIHDGSDEVTGLFPETTSGTLRGEYQGTSGETACFGKYGFSEKDYGSNSGSAARFFYCAKADSKERRSSNHPTVKPLDLMRYLVRLVTPAGATVLDPFAGSGTTLEAAMREHCRAIGIEQDQSHCQDAKRRLDQPSLFQDADQ